MNVVFGNHNFKSTGYISGALSFRGMLGHARELLSWLGMPSPRHLHIPEAKLQKKKKTRCLFFRQLANGYTKISVKDGDFLFTFEMSVFDEVNFRFYPNVLHNTKLFHPTRQTIGKL